MNKNSAQRFLPLIVALCLIAGILIGSFYANHFTGNRLSIIGSYFTMFVFGGLKAASARAARTKTSPSPWAFSYGSERPRRQFLSRECAIVSVGHP